MTKNVGGISLLHMWDMNVRPETELPGGVGQWFVAVMLYCVAMCFTVLQLTFGGAGRHPFKKEVYYVAACCSVLQPIFDGPSGPYKGGGYP